MIRTAFIISVATLLLALAFVGGHKAGQSKERAHWLEIENATLREQAKEITRQVEAVAAKQKEYNRAQTQINAFSDRLRTADRLRVKAEHEAAIERASAGNLRRYASGLHGLYSECREAYGDLAAEGARAAAAVGTMK